MPKPCWWRRRRRRESQNLTMTPAPTTTSRVRRSGNQSPALQLLVVASEPPPTQLPGAPLLPPGGVTPPDPDQYGTLECRNVASVHQVIQSLGMYCRLSCVSHW